MRWFSKIAPPVLVLSACATTWLDGEPRPVEARPVGPVTVVRTKVTVDAAGRVVKVVILDDPGHGFGEAIRKLLRGKRVNLEKLNGATEVPYTFVFEMPPDATPDSVPLTVQLSDVQ